MYVSTVGFICFAWAPLTNTRLDLQSNPSLQTLLEQAGIRPAPYLEYAIRGLAARYGARLRTGRPLARQLGSAVEPARAAMHELLRELVQQRYPADAPEDAPYAIGLHSVLQGHE